MWPKDNTKDMPSLALVSEGKPDDDFAEKLRANFQDTGTSFDDIRPITQLMDGVSVAAMNISGITHVSLNLITAFSTAKISVAGKFGRRGIYCAAGNYGGETIDFLRAQPGSHEHSLAIKGNFVVVTYGEGETGPNQRLLRYLEQHRGIPQSMLRTRDIRGDYMDLLENVSINGNRIDGIVLLFPKAGQAEVVIARKSASAVAIVSARPLGSPEAGTALQTKTL